MTASVAIGALLSGACLKVNPDFIDGSGSTGTASTSASTTSDSAGTSAGESGETEASSSAGDATMPSTTGEMGSSTTAASCEAELTQEPAPLDLGAFDLGSTGGADGALDVGIADSWFVLTVPVAQVGLVRLRAGVATPTTDEFQVCAYFDCDDASMAFIFDCEGSNDRDATSAGGRRGCCGDDPQVVAAFTCSGDFADARIQVMSPQPLQACVPFELAFELEEF